MKNHIISETKNLFFEKISSRPLFDTDAAEETNCVNKRKLFLSLLKKF